MLTTKQATPPPRARGRPREFDRATALERALEVFWYQGYEPATVAQLCLAMDIHPSSLYAAFGNKARLFLESVRHYETTYWDTAWQALEQEPDVFLAIERFFLESARILSSSNLPSGCMVILGATNISQDAHEVNSALRLLREESESCFLRRVKRAIADGQLPSEIDAIGYAATLNTLLEGMSIQGRDGASGGELERIAKIALRVIAQSA
jgi:AcrR family transcriptional regulator